MPNTAAAATNHLCLRRLHVYTTVHSHGKNDQEKKRVTIIDNKSLIILYCTTPVTDHHQNAPMPSRGASVTPPPCDANVLE